jgi:hypothetical protein
VHTHCAAAAAQTDRKCVDLKPQVCVVHEQFNKSLSLVSQTKLVCRRQSRYSVTTFVHLVYQTDKFLVERTQHRKCESRSDLCILDFAQMVGHTI